VGVEVKLYFAKAAAQKKTTSWISIFRSVCDLSHLSSYLTFYF